MEEALRRIDRGLYGACKSSGGPIGGVRLQAVPHAALCADVQVLEVSVTFEPKPAIKAVDPFSAPAGRGILCLDVDYGSRD